MAKVNTLLVFIIYLLGAATIKSFLLQQTVLPIHLIKWAILGQ